MVAALAKIDSIIMRIGPRDGKKEENVLFNDALIDSERGKSLPPHGLF